MVNLYLPMVNGPVETVVKIISLLTRKKMIKKCKRVEEAVNLETLCKLKKKKKV